MVRELRTKPGDGSDVLDTQSKTRPKHTSAAAAASFTVICLQEVPHQHQTRSSAASLTAKHTDTLSAL